MTPPHSVLVVDLMSHFLQLLVIGPGFDRPHPLVLTDCSDKQSVDNYVGITTDRGGEVGVPVQSKT